MQARKNHYVDDGSTGLAVHRFLAVFIRGQSYPNCAWVGFIVSRETINPTVHIAEDQKVAAARKKTPLVLNSPREGCSGI
jgi:hypothetical protein